MSAQKPTLHTCLSPALLHLYDLSDAVVVVIDVFRATSTMAAALHNGAACVIPVDEVAKALAISKKVNGIAAGERDGLVAEGLQHGNSPLEYGRDIIAGKTLVLTTTNGTRLLHMAVDKNAGAIITGSFPNLTAVCDYLSRENKNVVLACAGWKDRFCLEDTLFAGAVVSRIKHTFTLHCDSSLTAATLYEKHQGKLVDFAPSLTHYHRLAGQLGLIEDIRYCLCEDVAGVLPVYREDKLVALRD